MITEPISKIAAKTYGQGIEPRAHTFVKRDRRTQVIIGVCYVSAIALALGVDPDDKDFDRAGIPYSQAFAQALDAKIGYPLFALPTPEDVKGGFGGTNNLVCALVWYFDAHDGNVAETDVYADALQKRLLDNG